MQISLVQLKYLSSTQMVLMSYVEHITSAY